MNLICLRDLSSGQLSSFRSDFACIAKYLNKHYNRKQLIKDLQDKTTVLTHPKDTLYTLASLTGDKRYLVVRDKIKEGESKMCEIADELEKIGYDKGIEAGIETGIETGKYQTLISQTCCKLRKGYSAPEIADMLEEDLDTIQDICNVASSYAPDYDVEQILDTFLQLT